MATAIDSQGRVYAWGSNRNGELGHGDTRSRKLPTQVQALKRKKISDVMIGHHFVILLGKDVSLKEQMLKKQKRK